MKNTNKTFLKQGDNQYLSVKGNGVIYWIDEQATECRYYLHFSVDGRHQVYDLENGGSLSDFKRGQMIGWCCKIVAQSQPSFHEIPVIILDNIEAINHIVVDEHFNILNYQYD